MITLIVMLLMLPFQIWYERSHRFKCLHPVEQNLQRASQGFTLMVFMGYVALTLHSASGLSNAIERAVADPAGRWSDVMVAGLFIYGLVRFVIGIHGARQLPETRNGMLAFRALIKIAVGTIGFWWLRHNAEAAQLAHEYWIVWAFLMIAAWWCILTGAVRFLLTIGIAGQREYRSTTVLSSSNESDDIDDSSFEAARAAMEQRMQERKGSFDAKWRK